MRVDHQTNIFELIKIKIKGQDNLANAVGDVLSISPDAVYRRYRGETALTIFELEKLCKHFEISLDSLFEMNKNKVVFDFVPLDTYEFSMDNYLEGILKNIKIIKAQKNPELIMAITNTPFFQILNYPHLVRFKLFFWAKTHLMIEGYETKSFDYEQISSKTFDTGLEILKIYNSIPSKEIYDPELLRGFTREIFYYFEANHFKDPNYALYMLKLLDRFVDHLEAQAIIGKKFVSTTTPPASGNDFEMYHNETLNANASIYYKTDDHAGLHITHNLLNSIHTHDAEYLKDSLSVLNKQLANSSLISIVNEKNRNNYFAQIRQTINSFRKKIEVQLID
jgi:hypothetical protein